jgi:arylformamidase
MLECKTLWSEAMPLYDATLTIQEGMLTFPGDPQFKIEPVFRIQSGDRFNLALMSIGTHLGTHVDPPAHYLEGGTTVDQIPLSVLVGPGIVLDMRGVKKIGRQELQKSLVGDHPRVLFKTDNGPRLRGPAFTEDYVYLTDDGAEFLLERSIVLVGIDYLSIEKYNSPGATVHTILLNSGVLVVEGLDLLNVPAGPCKMYCLPLPIRGGDGAPARVLIDTDS